MTHVYKIAGLGEILWDIYDDKKFLGGAPTNFAAHVNQAGQYGLVLSRIGNDRLGDQLMHELISRNLDVSGIQIDPEKPTGTVRVTLDNAGQPTFVCTADVAFDAMQFEKSWATIAGQVDAVLFGTLAQRQDASRQAIHSFLRAAGKALKVYDVNLRGWSDETDKIVKASLTLADLIKLNGDELQILKTAFGSDENDEMFCRQLLDIYSIRLAAVTYGAKGCCLVTGDRTVRHPGFSVKAIDTTGSGDAFAAGMIIQYLQGADLETIAEFGNRLGAFVATRKGAVPEWSLEEVRALDG
ncbi:carbohydrate kinase [candidate division KSB1 bacterium]|nr:carbohydrate kinase [candidate division KSB1 bacterium]